jgi:hypothetical protein
VEGHCWQNLAWIVARHRYKQVRNGDTDQINKKTKVGGAWMASQQRREGNRTISGVECFGGFAYWCLLKSNALPDDEPWRTCYTYDVFRSNTSRHTHQQLATSMDVVEPSHKNQTSYFWFFSSPCFLFLSFIAFTYEHAKEVGPPSLFLWPSCPHR